MDGIITAILTASFVGLVYEFIHKTKNIKFLIARIVISIVAIILNMVFAIIMFCDDSLAKSNLNWLGIVPLVVVIPFLVLIFKDKKQLEVLNKEKQERLAKKEKEEKELQKKRLADERSKKSKFLLEQCGVHFFLKYYSQIVRLPVRDIAVEEFYSPEERNERLVAAKRIVNENLTALVADNILQNFRDFLTETEVEFAEKLKTA